MICKNCGKEVDNDALFCSHCGCRFVNAQNDNNIDYINESTEKHQEKNITLAQEKLDNEAQTSNFANNQVIDTQKAKDHKNISSKSRLVALLLALFIGSFGAHNFYLGKKTLAISQLIITLVAFFFMFIAMFTVSIFSMFVYIIAMLAVGIWVLVDFIFIIVGNAKDKDDKPVTRWTD